MMKKKNKKKVGSDDYSCCPLYYIIIQSLSHMTQKVRKHVCVLLDINNPQRPSSPVAPINKLKSHLEAKIVFDAVAVLLRTLDR